FSKRLLYGDCRPRDFVNKAIQFKAWCDTHTLSLTHTHTYAHNTSIYTHTHTHTEAEVKNSTHTHTHTHTQVNDSICCNPPYFCAIPLTTAHTQTQIIQFCFIYVNNKIV